MVNLEWRASYFKAHNQAWDAFSTEITGQKADAEAARPKDASINAVIHQNWIASFNSLADYLEQSLLGRGASSTTKLGDMLEEACRTYINQEGKAADLTQTEINKILADAGY